MLYLTISNQIKMDRVIIVFAVIGILMFGAYIYFIIKTSYDDEKQKKKEKLEEENELKNREQ
ncbi:MAG TPA: hypothetical protein DCX92_10180 [Bacteroidetes bacterium]|nr:hypothetical protein [Bacteroidota bacterium]